MEKTEIVLNGQKVILTKTQYNVLKEAIDKLIFTKPIPNDYHQTIEDLKYVFHLNFKTKKDLEKLEKDEA